MSRKTTLPQHRHHILVFDEDWEFLQANYGPTSAQPVGVSVIIRAVIHQRVLGLKAKAGKEFDLIRDQMGEEAREAN